MSVNYFLNFMIVMNLVVESLLLSVVNACGKNIFFKSCGTDAILQLGHHNAYNTIYIVKCVKQNIFQI